MKLAHLYLLLFTTASGFKLISAAVLDLPPLLIQGSNPSLERSGIGYRISHQSKKELASRESAWIKPAVTGAGALVGGGVSFGAFYGIFRSLFDPKKPIRTRAARPHRPLGADLGRGSSPTTSVLLLNPRTNPKTASGLDARHVVPRFAIPHWKPFTVAFLTALPFGGIAGGLAAFAQDFAESERAKSKAKPSPNPDVQPLPPPQSQAQPPYGIPATPGPPGNSGDANIPGTPADPGIP
ncbi:hypothetical protein A4X06_0g5680 [Tilletia controversa]|uniref:Uncharacterized protein n=1 Tax=Tilletia controversa TaxID=13291 RepID=A0A8X7MQM5_9BASI|nr:hypothetical protein CF328_g4815 [Tilletia controversa]KAE8245451.1 hypothetical protein A4X06_0g5680 [Tilletia controversa]